MDSYVNAVINAAVMTQVDLRSDLGAMIQLDFPERLLPIFLHESTHHWCFMSPLGSTLALLRLRAIRRATQLRSKRSGDHWDLLEDVLRQEVTIEYLRPFAEGLACFAELDSIPGSSNAISGPMTTIFFNFGGLGPDTQRLRQAGMNEFLYGLLYRARTDPDLARRRENVLAGPFSVAEGGHLAGYLSVKNIWRQVLKESNAALDAELFLCYLRSFFYDDYALIAVLLDPALTEHNAANAIAKYILKRFKQLLSMDWEKNLRAFEPSWTGRPTQPPPATRIMYTAYDGLENDAELVKTGKARLEALVLEVVQPKSNDVLEQAMAALDSLRMQKRELLCIGSLPAQVRVNEYGRAIATALDEGRIAAYPTSAGNALPGATVGEDGGALEFYLIPRDYSSVVAMSRGHEVVFLHYEGPISPQRQAELTALFGNRDLDLRMIEEQEANLEFIVARNSISLVRDQFKQTSSPVIDNTYSWLATLHFDPSQWRQAAQNLKEGGFFKLVGEDAEFVRGMAFLGVVSSVEDRWSELSKLATERGIDLEAIRKTAEQLERETGLRTLAVCDDRVLVFV